MKAMKKAGIKECVKRYSELRGCSLVEANTAMRTSLEVIKHELLNSGGVIFMDLFSIEAYVRKARTGVNPVTGQKQEIPPSVALRFKTGKKLKEELNK